MKSAKMHTSCRNRTLNIRQEKREVKQFQAACIRLPKVIVYSCHTLPPIETTAKGFG